MHKQTLRLIDQPRRRRRRRRHEAYLPHLLESLLMETSIAPPPYLTFRRAYLPHLSEESPHGDLQRPLPRRPPSPIEESPHGDLQRPSPGLPSSPIGESPHGDLQPPSPYLFPPSLGMSKPCSASRTTPLPFRPELLLRETARATLPHTAGRSGGTDDQSSVCRMAEVSEEYVPPPRGMTRLY